jgi:hypothetical protein
VGRGELHTAQFIKGVPFAPAVRNGQGPPLPTLIQVSMRRPASEIWPFFGSVSKIHWGVRTVDDAIEEGLER